MMLYVDVQKIQPNPWQTRERIDEAYVQELAADIKSRRDSRDATKGLLQRRLQACGRRRWWQIGWRICLRSRRDWRLEIREWRGANETLY